MTFIFGSVKIGTVESGGIVNFGNCASIPSAGRNSSSESEAAISNLTMLSFTPASSPTGANPLMTSPPATE